MCTPYFKDQPVWSWISAKQPDHLVLLGDSIYLDVAKGGGHPQQMSDDEFAHHLYRLYRELLAQRQFAALVGQLQPQRVWTVWDDHDFLWNDANGADESANPVQRGKVKLTTAFHEAFRQALAKGLTAGSFPDSYNHAAFWNPSQPPLSTPSVELAPDVWLHLADGRSVRTRSFLVAEAKRHLLGTGQRDRFAAAIEARPQAIHLLAAGSTLSAWKEHYPADWQWLNRLAAAQRLLVLSGDIHRNETDAFFTGGFPLHEATSSGAAVRDAVVIGKRRRNYGLLDIDGSDVGITLFADDKPETHWSRRLSRATWLPT
jgi:alkaline phosphatase D